MSIGVKPTVDFAFKKIFGSPENAVSLIELLNAVLDPNDPITDVEILNPFNRQEFESDKVIVLDVKARDAVGRWLNVEMQVTIHPGLLPRLTYYACSMYVEQLESGDNYSALRPAISICLLNRELFPGSQQAHHHFRLIDTESGRTLDESVEVHTVELLKYNLERRSIARRDPIEQWAFFLLFADQYDAQKLRELLPGVGFQQAITAIEAIAAKTEDRSMYDQRMKAQRDYQWTMESVREEGRVEGREEGREEGRVEGREEGREEGVAIGTIQTLQRLLNGAASPTSELAKMSKPSLESLIVELQQRMRDREA